MLPSGCGHLSFGDGYRKGMVREGFLPTQNSQSRPNFAVGNGKRPPTAQLGNLVSLLETSVAPTPH